MASVYHTVYVRIAIGDSSSHKPLNTKLVPTGSYYVITIRLLCDHYVIHIPCLSFLGEITIATVFPVNPVFDYPQYGEYGIYGIYLLYLV